MQSRSQSPRYSYLAEQIALGDEAFKSACVEDLGHVQTDATLSFVEPRPNGSNVIDQQFPDVKPRRNGRYTVGQQLQTLLGAVASGCTSLYSL